MPQPNRAMTESFPFSNKVGSIPIKLRADRKTYQAHLTWENRGEVTATVKLQDSADGVTYADVAGTSATVVPNGAVRPAGVTVRQYVQVVPVSGNTELELLLTPDVAAIELTKI